MICHLNYDFDKKFLRDFFFENIAKAKHHKTAKSEIPYWFKLFSCDHITDPILKDLNLMGMNVLPRFSYQEKNTRLVEHIDIDRIVGINLNLMPEPATIHINHHPYSYEAALIDVGTKLHSVEPIPTERLVLKFAIRETWSDLYQRLKLANLITTPDDEYISILKIEDQQFVKL
jgi:hypothetical protein